MGAAVLRFILGLALGSFLNVVAMRYDPDKFLFSHRVIGGRSHCPHCHRTLRWFELVPLASFLALGGHCRTCKSKLSSQYFFAELASGLLVALIPYAIPSFAAGPAAFLLLCSIWIIAAEMLLLLSLIDIRLTLIPDEIHIILVILAVLRIGIEAPFFLFGDTSFVSRYALLFGLQSGMWLNHILAALIGTLFFLALILGTRGRGMGMGDAKLAFALGILFGWPDVIFVIMFGFLTGAVFGIWKIIFEKGKLTGAVPFGPFLALGALILLLFGNTILGWYFSLFGIAP
jgi:prepilin signal peptidase PulO-like enzyme (type II secretory pathway)